MDQYSVKATVTEHQASSLHTAIVGTGGGVVDCRQLQ